MFLRIMAVLLGLVGLAGIGIALIASQKSEPVEQVAGAPPEAAAPAPAPALPKAHILTAAHPLRAGSLLVAEDVATAEVIPGQEPPGSFLDNAAARSALHGAMVRRGIGANEPILGTDVLSPGDRGFLAAVLGIGMRAITVGVDQISGTAGLIWPGDHVDLMLTQSLDDKDQPVERRISGETVLSNLRVIAVDQQLVQGGGPGTPAPAANNRTVTLEASSYDAQRIAVASRLGKISLVIRSAADDQPANGSSAAGSNILFNPPTASSAPASAPSPIAWSGDVSPALREHPSVKAGNAIRVYRGAKDPDEVRF